MVKLRVRKSSSAILPTYATDGSACFDFYSCKDILLERSRVARVPTGLAVEIPEGYFLEIRPRSGLASKGIVLVNSPATIDSDYRGEVVILLASLYETWMVLRGDRVAQGRLVKSESTVFELVEELTETSRGEGGFGSTGR